jgi:hypothetical protein
VGPGRSGAAWQAPARSTSSRARLGTLTFHFPLETSPSSDVHGAGAVEWELSTGMTSRVSVEEHGDEALEPIDRIAEIESLFGKRKAGRILEGPLKHHVQLRLACCQGYLPS